MAPRKPCRPIPDFLKDIPFEELPWNERLDQRGIQINLPEPDCHRYEFRDGPGGVVLGHWWDETGVTISQKGVLGPKCTHKEIVAWVLSLLPA